MKGILKKALLLGIWAAMFFAIQPTQAQSDVPVDRALYQEIVDNWPTDGNVVIVDGVPSIKLFWNNGQSISYICRFIRYFDNNFTFYRQQIALMNRVEWMAIKGAKDDLSTNLEFIYVPLNFSIRPKLLPEFLGRIEKYPKYILMDIGRQCVGLYENGKLAYLFPATSGRPGHDTPVREFTIIEKDPNHHSRTYNNAWMPMALKMFGNFWLHGRMLPGYPASHGCVGLIYENAQFLYGWAPMGTPGAVVNSLKQKI